MHFCHLPAESQSFQIEGSDATSLNLVLKKQTRQEDISLFILKNYQEDDYPVEKARIKSFDKCHLSFKAMHQDARVLIQPATFTMLIDSKVCHTHLNGSFR